MWMVGSKNGWMVDGDGSETCLLKQISLCFVGGQGYRASVRVTRKDLTVEVVGDMVIVVG